MHRLTHAAVAFALTIASSAVARADGLAGSPSSMVRQHAIAVKESYSFLRTSQDVRALATKGLLVPVTENADLALSKVSYAYARPEVRGFVERLAARYRETTGSRLVVTSLTRPSSAQPANAHKLSVHPAGMAVDFRVPASSSDRAYLESALLALEKEGVLDVTRERSPAHYHVAVFAAPYQRYAAREDSTNAITAADRARAEAVARPGTVAASAVAPGDTKPPAPILLALGLLLAVTVPALVRARRSETA